MPKQQLDLIDYFGPLAAWIVFFSVTFIISVTCILWCCVTEKDDVTVFAKWGMGPKPRKNVEYTVPKGE
ncbi:neuropeptide-like peptide 36 [Ditylenchus destructor]|nr:neuropeptide-like peptide 36 [Ditylenchus destructor]